MKKLLYFVLLIAGISSVYSCKDMTDEEGNPLLDLNDNTGLIGPRALNREVTDNGTIAEYDYNGLLLTRVRTPKNSTTNIDWSGDKISKISFNGFLDVDGDGIIDDDSISYTQQYTYGNFGRVTLISENRSVYKRGVPVPPSTVGDFELFAKTKALYNLTYSATTGKLVSIDKKRGPDLTGLQLVYNEYAKTTYTYLGDNVDEVNKQVGVIIGGVNEPPVQNYSFKFTKYDDKINAYTLLPFAYKINVLISGEVNDNRSMILSPNNPGRWSVTDLTKPVPPTTIFFSDFRYDPQTYITQGYAVNYFYKPM